MIRKFWSTHFAPVTCTQESYRKLPSGRCVWHMQSQSQSHFSRLSKLFGQAQQTSRFLEKHLCFSLPQCNYFWVFNTVETEHSDASPNQKPHQRYGYPAGSHSTNLPDAVGRNCPKHFCFLFPEMLDFCLWVRKCTTMPRPKNNCNIPIHKRHRFPTVTCAQGKKNGLM